MSLEPAQPIDPRIKAGAALAFLAIVGGLVYGLVVPTVSQGGRRAEIPWPDGGVPEGVRCIYTTGWADTATLQLFGLAAPDGGAYAYTRMCAAPSDGGEPSLPGNFLALAETQVESDYDGGPQFWAVLAGQPEIPCACSTGSDCTVTQTDLFDADAGSVTVAAPLGVTLGAGAWAGSGCRTKVCVEWAGNSSWPAECPRQ